uniref:Transposase n=1 Tax=Rhabditophanes sp. KR3021 TaxID=114890 RepID=A0AC35U378_9BILA
MRCPNDNISDYGGTKKKSATEKSVALLLYAETLQMLRDYLYQNLLDGHAVHMRKPIPNKNPESRIVEGLKYNTI